MKDNTRTSTIIQALREIQSEDWVANVAIAEAADRIEQLEAINAQLLDALEGLSRSAERQNWLHVATDYARATIAKAGVREYEKNPKYAERMVRWWDRYAGHSSCESIDQLRAAIANAKGEQP